MEVAAAVAAEAEAMEKAAGRVMEAQVEAGPEAEASAVVTAAVAEVGVARVAAADVPAAHREWRAETLGWEVEEATAAATASEVGTVAHKAVVAVAARAAAEKTAAMAVAVAAADELHAQHI